MAASGGEIPLTIPCVGAPMIGVLHRGTDGARRGIVIVVGGPQVRAGSHRQFVLLARRWAAAGVPVLRFDCRGKGDSGGRFVDFEHLDHDIAAAVDALVAHSPGLDEVFLWGLCDGASAILMYAHRDPRIAGVAILNPWVRTEEGVARTYLKHYYARKLMQPAFWRKALSGGMEIGASLASFVMMLRSLAARGGGGGADSPDPTSQSRPAPFPERMADGLARFPGRVLLILCGNDLTAREFLDCASRSRTWGHMIAAEKVVRHDLAAADHTFSRRTWREKVADWTLDWVSGPESVGSATR